MKIVPLGKRVLIKPIKEDEKTASGIYIPETAKEKKKQGIVVETSASMDAKECPIKKGDTILYSGYSFDEMDIDGEKYIVLDQKDIIAKIE
ncbi:MAG: co-chaperone GroES [ANME-2 cluster archaeon]|jgi:chaperonin GroES|nr:co-chaperone GroES [ANME-2 cluster archaeon]